MKEKVGIQAYLYERLSFIKKIQNIEDAHYADISLMLMAIISACATSRWPDTTGDKKKFLELLTQKSPSDFHLDWISIPSLINSEEINEQNTVYGILSNSCRIFTDEEVDMSFSDATQLGIDTRTLQRHCYAAIIYKERCSYSHEYTYSGNMTPYPPTTRKNRLSYINRGGKSKVRKILCLNLEYLFEIAEFHVKNLVEKEKPPSKWWYLS